MLKICRNLSVTLLCIYSLQGFAESDYSKEMIVKKVEAAGYTFFARDYLNTCKQDFPGLLNLDKKVAETESYLSILDRYFDAAPEKVKTFYYNKKNGDSVMQTINEQKANKEFTKRSCKNYIKNIWGADDHKMISAIAP